MPERPQFPSGVAEAAVLAGLFVLHLLSFGLGSPVHGPREIFAQDSVFILDSLLSAERYPWNPQSHVLYHLLVEWGYAAWRGVFGDDVDSTFRWLKLFTALLGLAFLVALRRVFVELGLPAPRRIVLSILAGASVAVWFHAAAFETHGLALPGIALWLLALVRLRDRATRTRGDRVLLVASLLLCGWARVDLYRFAAASVVLLALPSLRRFRRGLAVDLALVAVLGVAGTGTMIASYLKLPFGEAVARAFVRTERPELEDRVARAENLTPAHLLVVGRAITVYGVLMPVAAGPVDFRAPADTTARGAGDTSIALFREPLHRLLGRLPAALALAGLAAVLAIAAAFSAARLRVADPLHVTIAFAFVCGWLLYTLFDPFEPFLWIAEFVPLTLVVVADAWRGRGTGSWVALGAVTALTGLHNLIAFYLPLR